MEYVYPQLSSIDLNFTRIGGLGLGNMLFTYARAVLYARDHGAVLVWPTWNSIPVGQILRREDNKRFYHDLFCVPKALKEKDTSEVKNAEIQIVSGMQKVWLRMACTKVEETQANLVQGEEKRHMVVFTGMHGEFEPIAGYENSRFLYAHLKEILQKQNKIALDFAPDDAICMHVRLGDFHRQMTETDLKQGVPNASIPIAWYVHIVQQIRKAAGRELPVYLFSDGTDEELQELLELPGVTRKSFGTAIADIMAMTQAKLFIASGSTFSRWVRYLGRMNTICYPGQMGQRLLEDSEAAWEIEAEDLPEAICSRLKNSNAHQQAVQM